MFINKVEIELFTEDLFRLLFAADADKTSLKERFALLVVETASADTNQKKVAKDFFSAIPVIIDQSYQDAEAILSFDPAAQDFYEVIVAYPGFFATVAYRISHQLWKQGLRLLPRLISEYAHSKTGIDIHPAAVIGSAFVIDHGTGIVVGETTIIGNNVKIYQCVTLGALHVEKANAQSKRHPTIEDDVVIYSGATILGGNTVIGEGSIIGGNVWITHSILPNSVVYHKSEIKIKDKNPFPEPVHYII